MSKKILAITHQLDRTGAPIVLLNLLKLLSENGYSIDVYTLKDGELREDFEQVGFNVTLWERILSQRDKFIERAGQYDLVIANTLVAFEAIHALKTTNIPVIWWIHEGVHIFDYLKDLLPDIKSLPGNIHSIAVSPLVRRLIMEYYKVRVPVLPIPVTDYPPGIKNKNSKFRFLTMGMYSKAKGQDILAGAIKSLPEEIKDKSEFLFCGNEKTFDPEVLGAVRDLQKTENNIHILGNLPHDKALEILESSDCLIVPSREDPIPTVAVEAFMKEVLCICTDACGISDYMTSGRDGIVCKAFDSDALKIAIEAALDASFPIDSVGKRGRNIFIEKYSEERVIPKFLDLVENMSNNNRLIIFVGVYDILDIFAYRLRDAFRDMGYETFLFDSSDMKGSLSRLGPFVEKPVKAVITLNNLGYNMELRPGSIIWDDLNIPVINILMDHPFCYRDALVNSPRTSIVLSPDLNHMNYTTRFFPNIPVSGFLAHGGIELPGPKKKIKDRKYDVIYTGSISRAFADKIIPDWGKYDFDAQTLCKEVIAEIIDNPQMTTEEGIEKALVAAGVEFTEELLSQYISDFHYIDLYVTSHYREKVVETIARSGIKLDLFGFGWEICDWIKLPNVNYHGRIPAEEVLTIMQEAKIVLSTMTWFKEGTHDRVFNGMLQGALTVSDESGYMNREFVGRKNPDGADERDMILFSLSEIESLPLQLKEMLENPDLAQEIADRGYLKAKSDHTWENRAREIHEDILKQL